VCFRPANTFFTWSTRKSGISLTNLLARCGDPNGIVGISNSLSPPWRGRRSPEFMRPLASLHHHNLGILGLTIFGHWPGRRAMSSNLHTPPRSSYSSLNFRCSELTHSPALVKGFALQATVFAIELTWAAFCAQLGVPCPDARDEAPPLSTSPKVLPMFQSHVSSGSRTALRRHDPYMQDRPR
jgi:hypothetical protein